MLVVKINGKHKYLGTYDTAKQAAKAFDKEAIKLRRPISKLNYPKKAPVGYTPIQKAQQQQQQQQHIQINTSIPYNVMHSP